MTHMVEEMQAEAAAAVGEMIAAAERARALHARAELMRHMRGTAAAKRSPERVTAEWMLAWGLDAAAWPALAEAIGAFSAAFCRYAETPDDAADRVVRDCTDALEASFAAAGLSLADEMAWRSGCAHGWWALVRPAPAEYPGRPSVPARDPGQPFWQAGCAAHCR